MPIATRTATDDDECGVRASHIGGDVTVKKNSSFIVGAESCEIEGDVKIEKNRGGVVVLTSNVIGGNAEFEKNFGGLFVGVLDNEIGGELEIEKNTGVPPEIGCNTIDGEFVEGDGCED